MTLLESDGTAGLKPHWFLQVMGSLGSVEARAGVVSQQAAAEAHCPGATLSGKLLQTPQVKQC